MNAITREESLALSLPERAAVALGAAEHEIKLRELVLQSVAIVEVKNKAGREECHSAYMKLKDTRVNIGHKVTDVTEDAKLFTKAVKTEAERLVSIMSAEEDRLKTLRDSWDEAEQARKDALIAAERVRVDAIRADMQAIRDTPAGLAGANSAAIRAAIDLVEEIEATEARFAEYAAGAASVLTETIDRLVAMLDAATTAEEVAAAAEAARLAEIERMAAERAELAKLRAEAEERDRLAKIESERIAAEQAAESKRLRELAAAQEAELQKMRDAEAARARAAQAEQERVAAENKRQMEAQQVAIAAERRALEEQKAEAARAEQARVEAEQLRVQIAADHHEALVANVQFDIDREAERVRLQALADQQLADARDRAADERAAGLPSGALGVEAIADMQITDGPSAAEVLECAAMAVADKFEVSIAEAVEMIAGIERADFEVARELAGA